MPERNRLDTPLVCVLLAGLLFLPFILGRARLSQFDFSTFVAAGDRYSDPSQVPQALTVLRNSDGFDGQFYYRLALNPFTSQRTDFGITLDAPALRHQRILYPLLSFAVSLGSPSRLPLVMVLINLCALCILAWMGGVFAQTFKLHALWGMLFPLYPGFLLTLSRNTVEILEATLILGSLLLVRRNKFFAAALVLSLAVLTKETALIVSFAAAAVLLIEKRFDLKAWSFVAVPISVFALWQFTLFQVWGELPLGASRSSNLGIPFVPMLAALVDTFAHSPPYLRKFVELGFLIGFGVGVTLSLRPSAAARLEKFAWLITAGLTVCLGSSIWIEDWTFLRVSSLFFVLGVLVFITGKALVKYPVALCSMVLWAILFLRLMRNYA